MQMRALTVRVDGEVFWIYLWGKMIVTLFFYELIGGRELDFGVLLILVLDRVVEN